MRAFPPILVVATLLALPGCSDQDANRISRVSDKAWQRANKMGVEAGDKLGINVRQAGKQTQQKLDVIKPQSDSKELSERVLTRLKWDDLLEGLNIKVRADKGVITLSGSVRNEMQRRRAMALAESTKGVEKVLDSMELDVGTGGR
jgi:osmotically-inducible protein OsmY